MSYLASSTSSLQSTERVGQGAIVGGESQRKSSHTASIDILDDDSLLNVFYLYRSSSLGEDQDDEARLWGSTQQWVGEYWWYELAHVCQRWRNITLGSSSYLHISLVCRYGTPVADMLAYSPSLPLVIDYFDQPDYFTAEDEEGIILALKLRDHVRRVRLRLSITNLQRVVVAMDGEYPILEDLIIYAAIEDNSTTPIFPEKLRIPRLRHLALRDFALPIGSLTAPCLITFALFTSHNIPPSTHIQPNTLLQLLSFMPQLETLYIFTVWLSGDHDVQRQTTHMAVTTPITLPNLRLFRFQGISAYLEALGGRITTPRLENLQISYFNSITFSAPHLLQFMNTTENLILGFDCAKFNFSRMQVHMKVYPREEAKKNALTINIHCWYLTQVFSMTHVSDALNQLFSAVEYLTLEYAAQIRSWPPGDNEVDRIEWRNILMSFNNVKTLHVNDRLVEGLSRCLRLEDGEPPLDFLPELQELTYSGSDHDAFTSFIDARQRSGRPVTLVRHVPSPEPGFFAIH